MPSDLKDPSSLLFLPLCHFSTILPLLHSSLPHWFYSGPRRRLRICFQPHALPPSFFYPRDAARSTSSLQCLPPGSVTTGMIQHPALSCRTRNNSCLWVKVKDTHVNFSLLTLLDWLLLYEYNHDQTRQCKTRKQSPDHDNWYICEGLPRRPKKPLQRCLAVEVKRIRSRLFVRPWYITRLAFIHELKSAHREAVMWSSLSILNFIDMGTLLNIAKKKFHYFWTTVKMVQADFGGCGCYPLLWRHSLRLGATSIFRSLGWFQFFSISWLPSTRLRENVALSTSWLRTSKYGVLWYFCFGVYPFINWLPGRLRMLN